jgi:sterol desaturase/sphingolipid hydroxylase (fatty acid hydroxylase superfamily)
VTVDALLASLAAVLVLVVVYVPLERAFPARAQRFFRPEFGSDLLFLLGSYLVFAVGIGWVLREVFLALEATLGAAPWRATVDAAPLWLLVVGAVALGDLLIYWFHHACHHFEVLWRFHRVHHTVEHLDWLAAHREHPLDGLVTQLLLNLPAMLLGLPLRAIGGVIVFRGLWAIFIHSNVRVPLGPLRFVFGAPELHHWHHAKVERTAHNFANLAPYWDWVFGTYHADLSPETYPLGVPGDAPKSYWRHLLEPLGVRSRAASAVRDRPPRECALDR